MKSFSIRHGFVGLAMVLSALLAYVLTPRDMLAGHGPKVDLEVMIPKELGDWRVDSTVPVVVVSTDVQSRLNKIYSQTLSRTYINSQGQRVMLSIAYGADQSDSMQIHKPEVCYPSQGFAVISQNTDILIIDDHSLPVKRLVAVQGTRVEPITYWIAVGGHVSKSGLERKISSLKFGLSGTIPDGLLFRVSSLSSDSTREFQLHDSFVNAVASAITEPDKVRVFGLSP